MSNGTMTSDQYMVEIDGNAHTVSYVGDDRWVVEGNQSMRDDGQIGCFQMDEDGTLSEFMAKCLHCYDEYDKDIARETEWMEAQWEAWQDCYNPCRIS